MLKKLDRKLTIILMVAAMTLYVVAPAFAITNGEADGDRHPYVGLVVFEVDGYPQWRATGILIAPTVVLTAGHATEGATAARVWFEEDVDIHGYSYSTGTPYTYYGYEPGSNDVGIVVLDQPVDMEQYGEIPTPGIIDTLAKMTDVDLVGYGLSTMLTGDGKPSLTGPTIRQFAPAQLIGPTNMYGSDLIAVTANPGRDRGGTAAGDSGGPVLLKGTNIIIGLTAYRINPWSKGIELAQRIDLPEILAWIQSYTG